MSHNPKEAKKEMEKAIFISADCWLEVFRLLPPFQLGLGIAMISRRFDYFVDEHFKTRKWTLGKFKIGPNGTKEMKIVNSDEKELPIPQIPLPKKVIGFGFIEITYIHQNVLTFLRRFDRFFATCATKLAIATENVRISEFAVSTIWPMFKNTIREMTLPTIAFCQMRQLVPSILSNCPCLQIISFNDGILPAFPPDDSANASEGQALAKWLFTPRPDNLRKEMKIVNSAVHDWSAAVEQIKAAFSSASAPLNFSILVHLVSTSQFGPISFDSILPFELTNELTGEKLKLLQNSYFGILFFVCSQAGEEEKAMNKIEISIGDNGVDDGFMSTPVVALLRRIGRLLQSDITLALGSFFTDHTLSDIFATSIWPLLNVPVPSSSSNASAVVRMCLQSRQVLAQFRTVLSSPSVLRDCANLRLICVSAARLKFPPDDNAGATDDKALCKWLHTPRPNDRQPKVFGIFSRSSLPLEELKTNVESMWKKLKRNFKQQFGNKTDTYDTYFPEFVWRQRFGERENVFFNFWSHVSEFYPCQ